MYSINWTTIERCDYFWKTGPWCLWTDFHQRLVAKYENNYNNKDQEDKVALRSFI